MPVVNGTGVPPGVLEHPQAHGGLFVGAAVVGAARAADHSRVAVVSSIIPMRRSDRLEPLDVLPSS